MSYRTLEIWELAREVSIEIHSMTLTLPKFEQFEEAQQIRRSSKSVRSAIVEGYGRRSYKADYIKFITYALASNDETIDHLETLFETKSLNDVELYNNLHKKIEILGRKLNNFLKAIRDQHNKSQDKGDASEPEEKYLPASSNNHPASSTQYPVSSIEYPVSN